MSVVRGRVASALACAAMVRLRFTVWNSARLEGRAPVAFTSVDLNDETVTFGSAPFQSLLAKSFDRQVRTLSQVYRRPLLRARRTLNRRQIKRVKISAELDAAKQRAPANGDGSILGPVAGLGVSVLLAVPLSWGFVEKFEWPFLFNIVASVGLSIIDAIVAHYAGRYQAMLELNQPGTPFELTAPQRRGTKWSFAIALALAGILATVFAVLRSGDGGPVVLWLSVGGASTFIAVRSGTVGYPATRVRKVARVTGRLERVDKKVSDAFNNVDSIVRGVTTEGETRRERVLELNYRAGITFVRSFRRHHPPEALPPTMPELQLVTAQVMLERLIQPVPIPVAAALELDPQTGKTQVAQPVPPTSLGAVPDERDPRENSDSEAA
jgi:hypothetical protein